MRRNLRGFAAAGTLFLVMFAAEAACAQKQGGVFKVQSPDSPASMSIHEEATVFAEGPMMGVFNNLVIYDQHIPQSSLQCRGRCSTDHFLQPRRDMSATVR